jgi:hypothetical protein
VPIVSQFSVARFIRADLPCWWLRRPRGLRWSPT